MSKQSYYLDIGRTKLFEYTGQEPILFSGANFSTIGGSEIAPGKIAINIVDEHIWYASNDSIIELASTPFVHGNFVHITGDTMTGTLNVLTNVNVGTDTPAATASLFVEGAGDLLYLKKDSVSIGDGFFKIGSGTGAAGVYAPIFWSKGNSNGLPGQWFLGDIDGGTDTGSIPITKFEARYANGSVGTRPLFGWYNISSQKMILDVDGNLGIGTTSPSYKLDVNGDANISSGLTLSTGELNTSSVDLEINTGSGSTLELTYATWDDLRFPFAGQRLDSSSGRLDYNYFNGGVDFQSNARYPDEPISMLAQIPHTWKENTELRPHIHWLQVSSDVPNWLLAYKIIRNNQPNIKETDYTNYTLVSGTTKDIYTGGTLVQVNKFPSISPSDFNISDMIHFVIFRDSDNTSGAFPDVDPSSLVELTFEFDVHYQNNTLGSRLERNK